MDIAIHGIMNINNPIQHGKRMDYQMVYNTEDNTDGLYYATLEEAQASAIDTLEQWIIEERENWKCTDKIDDTITIYEPTKTQKDKWDYMINECYVEVKKYNPDTKEYEDYWSPSDDELREIGWLEWDEFLKTITVFHD